MNPSSTITCGPSAATCGSSAATCGSSAATCGPSAATCGPSAATCGPSAATSGLITVPMWVTIEELFRGCSKTHQFTRYYKHRQETGSVNIDIIPGTLPGHSFYFPREGNLVSEELGRGDLYVILNLIPSSLYELRGSDVHMTLDLSLNEAQNGFEHLISYLNDECLRIYYPTGIISSKHELIYPNYGLWNYQTNSYGHLVIHFNVFIKQVQVIDLSDYSSVYGERMTKSPHHGVHLSYPSVHPGVQSSYSSDFCSVSDSSKSNSSNSPKSKSSSRSRSSRSNKISSTSSSTSTSTSRSKSTHNSLTSSSTWTSPTVQRRKRPESFRSNRILTDISSWSSSQQTVSRPIRASPILRKDLDSLDSSGIEEAKVHPFENVLIEDDPQDIYLELTKQISKLNKIDIEEIKLEEIKQEPEIASPPKKWSEMIERMSEESKIWNNDKPNFLSSTQDTNTNLSDIFGGKSQKDEDEDENENEQEPSVTSLSTVYVDEELGLPLPVGRKYRPTPFIDQLDHLFSDKEPVHVCSPQKEKEANKEWTACRGPNLLQPNSEIYSPETSNKLTSLDDIFNSALLMGGNTPPTYELNVQGGPERSQSEEPIGPERSQSEEPTVSPANIYTSTRSKIKTTTNLNLDIDKIIGESIFTKRYNNITIPRTPFNSPLKIDNEQHVLPFYTFFPATVVKNYQEKEDYGFKPEWLKELNEPLLPKTEFANQTQSSVTEFARQTRSFVTDPPQTPVSPLNTLFNIPNIRVDAPLLPKLDTPLPSRQEQTKSVIGLGLDEMLRSLNEQTGAHCSQFNKQTDQQSPINMLSLPLSIGPDPEDPISEGPASIGSPLIDSPNREVNLHPFPPKPEDCLVKRDDTEITSAVDTSKEESPLRPLIKLPIPPATRPLTPKELPSPKVENSTPKQEYKRQGSFDSSIELLSNSSKKEGEACSVM